MWGELATLGLQAYSAYSAAQGQKRANEQQMEFNSAEAQKQRDWEEGLAKTKYQWTRKDLEAAGYNPLMALGVNPGVPSGASANAAPQSTTKDAAHIVSQSALNAASILKIKSDARLNESMAQTQSTQQVLNLANAKAAAASSNLHDFQRDPKLPGTNWSLTGMWNTAKEAAAKAFPNTFGKGGTPEWVRRYHNI